MCSSDIKFGKDQLYVIYSEKSNCPNPPVISSSGTTVVSAAIHERAAGIMLLWSLSYRPLWTLEIKCLFIMHVWIQFVGFVMLMLWVCLKCIESHSVEIWPAESEMEILGSQFFCLFFHDLLLGWKSCFSCKLQKIIAEVFPSWPWVNTAECSRAAKS